VVGAGLNVLADALGDLTDVVDLGPNGGEVVLLEGFILGVPCSVRCQSASRPVCEGRPGAPIRTQGAAT
jgi:hypothetical protein